MSPQFDYVIPPSPLLCLFLPHHLFNLLTLTLGYPGIGTNCQSNFGQLQPFGAGICEDLCSRDGLV